MTGALINALGIVVGGAWGLAALRPIPKPDPTGRKLIPRVYTVCRRFLALALGDGSTLKLFLGLCTVWLGLKLAWVSFNGGFRKTVEELGIVVLALILGKLTGKLLRLQKLSNSIGRRARQIMAAPPTESERKRNDGFVVATGLFCAGPLALLASVQEGLNGFSPVFVVKAGIDGLATYAFCETFGWGVVLSAIPVLALESALIRGGQLLEPVLRHQSRPLLDAVNAADGLLIFCVAMIILGLKKIEVADYFPSLAFAPLLTWWLWR